MADNPKRVLDTLRAHIQELMRRCNVLKREKEELEKRIEEQKSTIATLQRDLDEMSIKYQDLLPAKQVKILQKGADSSLHTFMLQKWKKQAKIHGETAQLKWKKPPVVMALVDDKI